MILNAGTTAVTVNAVKAFGTVPDTYNATQCQGHGAEFHGRCPFSVAAAALFLAILALYHASFVHGYVFSCIALMPCSRAMFSIMNISHQRFVLEYDSSHSCFSCIHIVLCLCFRMHARMACPELIFEYSSHALSDFILWSLMRQSVLEMSLPELLCDTSVLVTMAAQASLQILSHALHACDEVSDDLDPSRPGPARKASTPWLLVGTGMGYRDYHKGPWRDSHRDPFPHFLFKNQGVKHGFNELCRNVGIAWSFWQVRNVPRHPKLMLLCW